MWGKDAQEPKLKVVRQLVIQLNINVEVQRRHIRQDRDAGVDRVSEL